METILPTMPLKNPITAQYDDYGQGNDFKTPFHELNEEDRHQVYRREFAHRAQPLHLLSEPQLLLDNPDFSEEITQAYFSLTIFTVKVWTNYDAAEERFFLDDRTRDTGKLRLPAQKLQWLKDMRAFRPRRIDLEIGTAFRTLCTLRIRPRRPRVFDQGIYYISPKATLVWQSGEPPKHLRNFIQNQCSCLFHRYDDPQAVYYDAGIAFELQQLQHIAAAFRFVPAAEQLRGYWTGTSQRHSFMGLDDFDVEDLASLSLVV